MKIALINTFYPPYNFGGDGVYVRRLAHALARRGCEVHVLHDVDTYRALAPKPQTPVEPLAEPPGIFVRRLESPLGSLASAITYESGRQLVHRASLRAFFRTKFDVTHFHNVSLVGGPGVLSMGSGVKLYTAHEHWLVCPTHLLWRHGRELCTQRQCIRCQLAHRRPPQLWRFTRYLERQAAHVDAFIALSRSSADNHRRFGFPFEMRVLPSFLPDRESPHPNPTAKAGRPYALFVGRLEKIKGLQDLIPEFAANPAIDLVVVGDGDYGPQLKRIAANAPTIKFLGRVDPEDLWPLYAGAAAVVLPSICYEVFPLVAIEAFRAGAPIVARDLGPFPEILASGEAGALFRHPSEAHAAVARFAADVELRRKAGAHARRAFERRWSEKPALSAYFGLIAEKAGEKGLADVAAEARALMAF
jgi:glycosyltransferase involved in cell wall biosynthesis